MQAPSLASLKTMFEESASLTILARKEARIDQDYYDGYQWTADERAALKARKQPDTVFNRVRPAVNGTLGVLKQGATDPRAYPRTPKDEDAADVASKTLRFIADQNQFDDLKMRGAKDYLVMGTCAAICEVDEDLKIVIEPIRWEEFFYDPRSRKETFGDARYMGCAKWQYADDVVRRYPDVKSSLDMEIEAGAATVDESFEDRPGDASNTVAWVDKRKRRVMVVEIYHREADGWRRCVYYSGGILEYGPSPYLDDKKRPCCPIEAQSCFIDRGNNRYGMVRDMRGPQDEINKRRSKLLHLVSSSQIQAVDPSAVATDANTARKEAARPDGVIPYGWQKVPTVDMASGQASLLAEAKGEIERMGPNPAILGREGESSSGRAQLIRQQAGIIEQAIIYGGIEEWELRLYRQMWDRARQFWTAPMFVRVTDDEGAPKFIGLNQPTGQPKIDDQTGEMALDPQTGQPVEDVENPIAELDVDIIIDATPDTANVQQEQFEALIEMARMYGPQEVPFEDILLLSSMPGKRQVMERRKARQEEQGQQQQTQQQMQMQMAQAGTQAAIENTQSQTALNMAKAETTMFNAQVDADKALHGVMKPAAGDMGVQAA